MSASGLVNDIRVASADIKKAPEGASHTEHRNKLI
ncbi:hypothetical protein SAMN05192562_10186 [Kosakonia arachidis]|uniref:Uncharacterized protein n=1 Tax=Kosakonia arachidis TaxID=551989 RepID=A0A1I6XN50_9ENTR|nr:hypothetical protein SAMN05192562_10186 [Kosakonia arachidis]